MTTQIRLPIGAEESVRRFFRTLFTSVVDITFRNQLPQSLDPKSLFVHCLMHSGSPTDELLIISRSL